MTNRLIALTIVLERDIRDDDAEPLIQAIRMLRGVADVVPQVADISDYVARERAKLELRQQIADLLRPST